MYTFPPALLMANSSRSIFAVSMPAATDHVLEPSTIDALPAVGAFTISTFAPSALPSISDISLAANVTEPGAPGATTTSAFAPVSSTAPRFMAASAAAERDSISSLIFSLLFMFRVFL